MKKRAVFLFFCVFCVALFAQNTSRQEEADIVVMMDTSGTILPYYDDINIRVLNEINSKFMRPGDTFHLISFNAKATHELTQKITTETDLSRLVSRFMLLYQVGHNSDFLTAMDFAEDYTQDLVTKNKEKILIIISDGIFNPAESSPYSHYTNEQVKNKIATIANNIRKENWKVYFVKLPFPDNVIIRDLDDTVISKGTSGQVTGNADSTTDNSDNSSKGSSDGYTDNSTGGSSGSDGLTGGNTDIGNSQNADSDSNGDDSIASVGSNSNSSSDSSGSNVSIGSSDGSVSGADEENNAENSKEYHDISGEITKTTGITESKLPKDPNADFNINDDNANLPEVVFPTELNAKSNYLKMPLIVKNNGDTSTDLILTDVAISKGDQIYKVDIENVVINLDANSQTNVTAKIKLPSDFTAGNYDTTVRLVFADNKATIPQIAVLPMTVSPSFFSKVFNSDYTWIYIVLIIIVLLLLLLLLIFMIRRHTSSPVVRTMHKTAQATGYTQEERRYPTQNSEKVDYSNSLNSYSQADKSDSAYRAQTREDYAKDLAKQSADEARARLSLLNATPTYAPASSTEKIEIKRNQSGMTEIYVFNQNRSIGKRNIHVMKPGTRLSVGGGRSDSFLIFLVKFPPHLAEVRYDGQDYHLAILKPKYFPYETSNTVNNCIGKTITVVSDKGYHVGFTFRGYEDPLSNLNKLLTSIDYT